MADSLNKWLRPGSPATSAPAKETGSAGAQTMELTPYKPFGETVGSARLWLRPGGANPGVALPYGYLTQITADDYGIVCGLTYSIPFPGPVVVQIMGEQMMPLTEAIIKGNAAWVQAFDPGRHSEPAEGSMVIREILIVDKPTEAPTAH